MSRREFIALVGGAVAWPVAAGAQRAAMPVVGLLSPRSPGENTHLVAALRRGLSETGFVEGQNVAIEYRWAQGQNDRFPALAADLLRRQVAVIAVFGSTPAALAAKAATTTVPIVFLVGLDPIEGGLVTSLNRPGGNITGVSTWAVQLESKYLELLREFVPTATIMAALVNPISHVAEIQSRNLQAAASTLGLQIHVLRASTEPEFQTVFASLVQLRASALVISGDPLFTARSNQLAALSVRHAVPAIYAFREFADGGGLMTYGTSITDAYRLLGVHIGRILKGEKPADMPVQQVTKVELVINLKTAKTLGITVPPTLLARADEVIE